MSLLAGILVAIWIVSLFLYRSDGDFYGEEVAGAYRRRTAVQRHRTKWRPFSAI
ncbi:hypothetical protein JGU71_24440 [Antrihabitans sp. YC3-6]|uniref:Uncharacterized protein n=1 Tax=Antrihabitans stalagmiti TaxID=2799499 RepID=A0A934NVH7_9NOCA|nr:hypothetical protein [Antrihabitans stalagmiti]MBJ8342042.1 hypothetical protein [Antrihabitans stalagmiti]